uniref:Methyltransferase FkbM domain-containing protein n=1 Tax=viral metagenome TaxID=1070528 RepID=A0A6C0KR43_9ZZZZ
MSLDYVRIFESDRGKVRIGSSHDGGYVVVDNLEYDCFLSCGIGNDVQFEKEFCSQYPTVPCIAFDGTIDRLPEENAHIQFIKKNITAFESDTTTNLLEWIEKYDNIFLKMDIETFEFRWLQILTEQHLQKIKQLIVEFHFPWTEPGFTHLDTPLPIDQKQDVLKKLSQHIHLFTCIRIIAVVQRYMRGTSYRMCLNVRIFERIFNFQSDAIQCLYQHHWIGLICHMRIFLSQVILSLYIHKEIEYKEIEYKEIEYKEIEYKEIE